MTVMMVDVSWTASHQTKQIAQPEQATEAVARLAMEYPHARSCISFARKREMRDTGQSSSNITSDQCKYWSRECNLT